METIEKNKARAGRTPRFNRDVVIRTALKVIDRDGYQAFSMRALAAEMGIAVMTLYVYVPTREEIVVEIGKLLLGKLGTDLGPDAAWDARIDSLIRELYDVMEAHPGAIDIFVSELSSPPASDRVTDHVRETLLGILISNGFSIEETINTVGSLLDYVLGHAIVHRNYVFRSRKTAAQSRTTSDSRKRYPFIVKVASSYKSNSSRRSFEFGLDILLDGVRSHFQSKLPKRRKPNRATPLSAS